MTNLPIQTGLRRRYPPIPECVHVPIRQRRRRHVVRPVACQCELQIAVDRVDGRNAHPPVGLVVSGLDPLALRIHNGRQVAVPVVLGLRNRVVGFPRAPYTLRATDAGARILSPR